MATEKEKQGRSEHRSNERDDRKQAHQKTENARSEKKDQNREPSGEKTTRSSKTREKKQYRLQPGESDTTTDHEVIRKWIEERGGTPASVGATEGKNDPGLLRIDFPNRGTGRRLEPISWEAFFEKFDEKNLAFLYQEQTRTGRESRFSKFVSRETAQNQEKGSSSRGKGKQNKSGKE